MSNATFGTKVEIYITAAYVEIKGATNIVVPRLQKQESLSKLTQDMTGGIEEKVHPKTFSWANGSADFDQIPADAGQVGLVAAAAGTTVAKFKFTKPGVDPVIVNAFVTIEERDNPINGLQGISATFDCTGASPVS